MYVVICCRVCSGVQVCPFLPSYSGAQIYYCLFLNFQIFSARTMKTSMNKSDVYSYSGGQFGVAWLVLLFACKGAWGKENMRDRVSAFSCCIVTKDACWNVDKTMQFGEGTAIWRNINASNARLQLSETLWTNPCSSHEMDKKKQIQ